jgi:hypothetical protein
MEWVADAFTDAGGRIHNKVSKKMYQGAVSDGSSDWKGLELTHATASMTPDDSTSLQKKMRTAPFGSPDGRFKRCSLFGFLIQAPGR